MKPVLLRGYFDHNKEIQIEKHLNGEKGVEIITPFFTHLNNSEEPQSILVNRGWMAEDLKEWRYDKTQDLVRVRGVLYRGDAQTKYTKPNRPLLSKYRSVRPEELAVVNQINNEQEASQFMVRAIDFDENARSIHPTVPSPCDL